MLLRAATLALALLSAAPAPRAADGAHHVRPLTLTGRAQPGFTLTDPAATGAAFTNSIPAARHLTNQIYLNGSGVALADVDGDGLTDVFLAGFDGDNALLRNLGGWRFTNVAAAAGVAMPGRDATGAAFADLDADGDPDLVVNTLGQGTHVFLNEGRGSFRPAPFLLNPGGAGMTAAVADVDGDGWPDVYLANYRSSALMDLPNARATFRRENGRLVVDTLNGRPATAPDLAGRFSVNDRGGIEEHGEPDVLYRNLGGTNFAAVPWTGGAFLDEDGRPLTAPPRDWGLAAMFRDVNGDGRPDLYVCNDFHSPDRLWLNQGEGRLRLAPAATLRRTSLSSMAVDFADLDRDGHDDFIVFDMLGRDHAQRMRFVGDAFPDVPRPGVFLHRPQIEQNTVFRARGDGTFAEVAPWAGLAATDWTWSGAFLDVDLDGLDDLLVVNGMERAARDPDVNERLKAMRAARRMSDAEIFAARRAFPRLAPPNLAFRNHGGLRFAETGAVWGFDLAGVTSALALGDLDGDGDLDVVLNNLNAGASFYRNDAAAPRVAVRLRGQPPNTAGLGAKIRVAGGPLPQSQEMIAGGRYLSGDEALRVFAAGTPTNRLTVEVTWPGGRTSVVTNVLANTALEIHEPDTPTPPSTIHPSRFTPPPHFTDATDALALTAPEEPFDDYARQALLPYKLSQPGPPAAWVDVDGDGFEDVVVGGAAGGRIKVRRNDGRGGLTPLTNGWTAAPLTRDATAVLGWREGTNLPSLLVALSNYEDGVTNGVALRRLAPGGAADGELLLDSAASAGPLALADVDGDGDLDLFVGGRVVAGRWPAAADSRLLRREADGWREQPEDAALLRGLGLVTAAVFSDLTGDGLPELVVACEWGPLRFFRNDAGRLTTWEVALAGHSKFEISDSKDLTGLWQSLAAGDFDGDGRMDLVAGNWGRNTSLEIPPSVKPPRIWHGDFNGDGTHEVLEAAWEPARGAYVPRRQLDDVVAAWPGLRERFPTHAAWAATDVGKILAGAADPAFVEAAVLESLVLLNRGDRFEVRALPDEAQLAPVMALAVADFDGDGAEDVVAAQNFFPLRPGSPRLDGGVTALLLGDGRGGFRPVPSGESGVAVFGEARAAAVADFDRDARADVLVTQGGAAARLFRNAVARPGVRVRLAGPPGNPDGVGTRLRVVTRAGGFGPAREVQVAGTVTVLARPDDATEIEVRWPGGVVRRAAVPAAGEEARVEHAPR
ncbi:MAG: VCBS repeat-containing protein [Limisphaerales bacterium]